MARHVPLYQAVLNVLRAIALCPVLLPLLLPRSNGYSPSHQDRASLEAPCIATLLDKMRQCVDTYSRTLRFVSQHSWWQFHKKGDAVKTYTWPLTCNVVLIFWAWAACGLFARAWLVYNEPTIVRGRLRTRIWLQLRSVARPDSNLVIPLDAQFSNKY